MNSVLIVLGSTPVGDSDLFFDPGSCNVDQFSFHKTFLFFSFFCSAPEISLKPEENRREELYYSDQYHSDPDAEEPLLSHKTNTPSYSI